MAGARRPIFPHLTPATFALLAETCAQLGCTQSDVVEGALLAYLRPRGETDRDTMTNYRLASLETGLASLAPLLKKIVERLEPSAAPPEVADLEDFYAQAEESLPTPTGADALSLDAERPQSGGWRRLFPRRERR